MTATNSERGSRVARYLADEAAARNALATHTPEIRARLEAWQEGQSEWFSDTLLEIVAEFITFDDKARIQPTGGDVGEREGPSATTEIGEITNRRLRVLGEALAATREEAPSVDEVQAASQQREEGVIGRAGASIQAAWDDGSDVASNLPPIEFTEAEMAHLARAVLVAIRDPSEIMAQAGREVPCDAEAPGGVIYSTKAEATAIWQAMIDAALSEVTTRASRGRVEGKE